MPLDTLNPPSCVCTCTPALHRHDNHGASLRRTILRVHTTQSTHTLPPLSLISPPPSVYDICALPRKLGAATNPNKDTENAQISLPTKPKTAISSHGSLCKRQGREG